MAQKKMGVVVTLGPESKFDKLKFIPLEPKFEFGTVLIWKKNQIQSGIAEAFVEFAKKCIKGI